MRSLVCGSNVNCDQYGLNYSPYKLEYKLLFFQRRAIDSTSFVRFILCVCSTHPLLSGQSSSSECSLSLWLSIVKKSKINYTTKNYSRTVHCVWTVSKYISKHFKEFHIKLSDTQRTCSKKVQEDEKTVVSLVEFRRERLLGFGYHFE